MHTMGTEEINALDNPSVYSMSNIRDVVNRLVSGFFYGSQHAPQCAKEDVVVSRFVDWLYYGVHSLALRTTLKRYMLYTW